MIPFGPVIGALAWFRSTTVGRTLALGVSVVVAILTMRALWRRDGAREARRAIREESNAAAIERVEARDAIDLDVADGGARERLLWGWSRGGD